MRPESELRSLISRSQKDGFQALFQKYFGYVYAIVWNCIRSVGSHEDAEECVNDIFIEEFRQFDEIEPGKLHGYIGTVAKRRAINCFHRLTAKPQAISIEEQSLQTLAAEDSVEQDFDKAALRQVLLDQIRMLGEPDATIIMMKYFYDAAPDQIAKTVGMKQPAVRKRLSRAMKRLRDLLGKNGYTMNGGDG